MNLTILTNSRFRNLNFPTIWQISKIHKMAVFVVHILPKLISRNFWMIEKFLNFHTVFLWSSHHIWHWISFKIFNSEVWMWKIFYKFLLRVQISFDEKKLYSSYCNHVKWKILWDLVSVCMLNNLSDLHYYYSMRIIIIFMKWQLFSRMQF